LNRNIVYNEVGFLQNVEKTEVKAGALSVVLLLHYRNVIERFTYFSRLLTAIIGSG